MSHVMIETEKTAAAAQPSESQGKRKKKTPAAPRGKARKASKKTARKAAAKASKVRHKPAAGPSNKKAEVIAMMSRSQGATLAEIVAATGWQKHTVRGFVSVLGKKGEAKIDSSRNAAGERTYKIGI